MEQVAIGIGCNALGWFIFEPVSEIIGVVIDQEDEDSSQIIFEEVFING